MMTALTIYAACFLTAFCLNLWKGTAPDGSPSSVSDSFKIGLVWPLIIVVALVAYFSDED